MPVNRQNKYRTRGEFVWVSRMGRVKLGLISRVFSEIAEIARINP